ATPQEPVLAHLADVDANGALDFIPFTYFDNEEGQRQLFTFFNRGDMAKQVNKVKSDYTTHAAFARAPAENFRAPDDDQTEVYNFTANEFRSVYLENGPDGFKIYPLPLAAQAFPIFGMLPIDLNEDNHLDVLCIGNDYGGETGQGYLDAGNGLTLLGNGKGQFRVLSSSESGFSVPGEGRALVQLKGANGPIIIAGQNTGPLVLTAPTRKLSTYTLQSAAETIDLPNGEKRRVERYWGSGYLGQSGRNILVPSN
ncbi:MAG: hypothetical protein AAFQ37_10475, partial [Bacteroidota bacterium]